MLTSPRTLSLFVLLLAACSSSESETADPAPEQVGGGQSGTGSSGELGQRCDPVGEATVVPESETIEALGRSAEDMADALAGMHVVPCIGGDGGTCADFGTLSVDVVPTGVATVQPGEMYYFHGSEDMPAEQEGDPEPCAIVRIGAQVRIETSNGTLSATASELVTTRGNHAALKTSAPTTLFGDEQDIRVNVSFVGVTSSPRAIDAVLEIDSTHRALYAWDSEDQGHSGGAGGADNGIEHSGGAGGADHSVVEEAGGAGGSDHPGVEEAGGAGGSEREHVAAGHAGAP